MAEEEIGLLDQTFTANVPTLLLYIVGKTHILFACWSILAECNQNTNIEMSHSTFPYTMFGVILTNLPPLLLTNSLPLSLM